MEELVLVLEVVVLPLDRLHDDLELLRRDRAGLVFSGLAEELPKLGAQLFKHARPPPIADPSGRWLASSARSRAPGLLPCPAAVGSRPAS